MAAPDVEPLHQVTNVCREATELLERSLALPTLELTPQVDEAERCVVKLRDALIDALRAGRGDRAQTRAALDRVNVALSLIVGVEYPAVGIQRSMLKEARDALRPVLSYATAS